MVRSVQSAIILIFLNFSIVTVKLLNCHFFIVATVNNSLFYLFCYLGLITGYEYRKKLSVLFRTYFTSTLIFTHLSIFLSMKRFFLPFEGKGMIFLPYNFYKWLRAIIFNVDCVSILNYNQIRFSYIQRKMWL